MSKRKHSKKTAKTLQKRSQGAQRHKGSTSLRGKIVRAGLIMLVLGITGFYGFPYLTPAPTAIHPENTANLDPAVKALIEPLIASIEANPRAAANHAELGLAYEANGLWHEARKSYDNAVLLNRSNKDWQLHRAIVTRQAGDFQSALTILTSEAKKNPTSAPIQHHYADALLEAGNLSEAEEAFRTVIQLSPQSAQGYVGLGDILIQKNAGQEAVQVLEQAVERNPKYRQAIYLLGRAYGLVGRDQEAQAALRQGINADVQYLPDAFSGKIASYTVNATGRISQASTLLNTGNAEQAARLLEESYIYHNTNVMLLNTLASAYLRTNKLEDAYRLLTRASTLDENQFFTYLNLYTWALRSGKNELALSYADKAIERAPERDDTHLAKAQALTELKRFEEALVSATKAVEIDESKAGNHGLMGEILFRLEQFSTADKHFQHALDINPNLLPVLVGQAQTKWELQAYPQARQLLKRAQRIAPNHPRVQQLSHQFNASR